MYLYKIKYNIEYLLEYNCLQLILGEIIFYKLYSLFKFEEKFLIFNYCNIYRLLLFMILLGKE